MNIVKCENSHFFDSEKHDKCPHCGSVAKKFKKQKAENLSAEEINLLIKSFKLKLSYGDFPVHNVEYHNGTVKFYNRINPRDGGRRYPEHFFDEFQLILNDEQINHLNKIICSLEFVKYSADETPKIFNDGEPSKSYYKLITDDGITNLIEDAHFLVEFFEEICNYPEIENSFNNIIDLRSVRLTYPEKISLFIVSKNKDAFVEKTSFFVGRSPECDIRFDASLVSRIHAIFCYNAGTWYIQDLSSTNGVWINDVKLEPMKMYRLKENDIIDLAHSEKLIFFKDNEDTEVLLI